MSNGKGDTPRPLSVDQKTFATNWERAFAKQEICEYSGLPPVVSYNEIPPEYTQIVSSGKFFELYPGLSGNWNEDKHRWWIIVERQRMGMYE